MKALDFLSGTPRVRPAVCLWGGCYTLQKLVTDKILALWSDMDDVERASAQTMTMLIGGIEEGSISGRVLVVDYEGGWKETTEVSVALQDLELDRVIIRCTKEPPALPFTSVNCSQISRKPSRAKFLGIRRPQYGLEFSDEALEAVVTRTTGVESVESALQMISFLVSGREVILKDVDEVVALPESRSYLMRAVLTANPMMFSRELQKGDPVAVLYSLHTCYFRLFTFVESYHGGSESEAQSLLKITQRDLKDWKAATTKYRTNTLRKLMELSHRMLVQVMSGNSSGWQARLMLEAKLILGGDSV